MLQISADQVYEALPISDCIDLIERTMMAVSRGEADLPLRWIMPLGDGNAMGVMPGGLKNPPVHGMKLISLYPDNPKRGLSSHQGILALFDTNDGRPLAILDGASITAQRTAAASAAATRALSRADARKLAILGAGEQADHHLPAQLAVRPFQEVRVWTRTFEHATDYARRHGDLVADIRAVETAAEAVEGSDVIVTVTASASAILEGAWLEPGQHVNLVGASVATAREIDDAGLARGRYFVDTIAGAKAQAGEFVDALRAGAITEDHLIGEVGQVYGGALAGRTSYDDITIYKSLGIAAQDIATGYEIWNRLRGKLVGDDGLEPPTSSV